MSVAPLTVNTSGTDVRSNMQQLGRAAVQASTVLALSGGAQRRAALLAAAAAVRAQASSILEANRLDMEAARAAQLSAALLDRLMLDAKRVAAMAQGLEAVAALADPLGTIIAEWTRPNGLRIQRVRVPLGVIGIIYESRPNVTAHA